MAYDIIGDIHGCLHELKKLIAQLGYHEESGLYVHDQGRKLVFVGDLTDRGPASVKTIELVYRLVKHQLALYAPGNHCNKLYRYMLGRPVQIKHGLETTVAELEALDQQQKQKVYHDFMTLYDEAPLYLQLDNGKLVVAHAGIREKDIGQINKRIKSFVLYGDTTGDFDEQGRPIRLDWARHYKGDTWVVYGHTPVKRPRWKNHTVNIDTGCVFGGMLTALRYPEMETVSVPSEQPYIEDKFRDFED
ncbi:protein phosphatase [Scopulibacillus daqui]|uniref:Protein phosphatase n=1 Tax=Scopulibacillus daqui TaxID=1469162 RepID=A0ABS2PVK4_9BACL|nr:bis(5'-nucleosyl)-tetraphosphatase PrpE [Scopulibacillus daqui]MBM7644045.1 protein phosphatase [Scopulibacillus daqui]